MTAAAKTVAPDAAIELAEKSAGFRFPKWMLGGSAGTGIGAVILGAISWANSVSTTVTRIETKMDDIKERVQRLEDHQFGTARDSRRLPRRDAGDEGH